MVFPICMVRAWRDRVRNASSAFEQSGSRVLGFDNESCLPIYGTGWYFHSRSQLITVGTQPWQEACKQDERAQVATSSRLRHPLTRIMEFIRI